MTKRKSAEFNFQLLSDQLKVLKVLESNKSNYLGLMLESFNREEFLLGRGIILAIMAGPKRKSLVDIQ